MIRAVIVAAAVLAAAPAQADPDERTGRERVYHMLPIVGGGALYALSEFTFKELITPTICRWCTPNRFDTAARDLLLWRDPVIPNGLSNMTGYILNPLLATGGLALSSIDDPSGRRVFDDIVPVVQAGIATGLVNQGFKILFGRQRPFVYHKGYAIRPDNDLNTSFFSGHTAIAFTMATASGTVASLREYRSAPYLWAGGLTLATLTGVLRIGSDAHYATDVLAGAVIGAAIGVAVPLLFHRDVLTDEADPIARTSKTNAREPFIMSFGGAF